MQPEHKEVMSKLLEEIIILAKKEDLELLALLAEKKIYRKGSSGVVFHLNLLKELIEKA